VDTLKTSFQTCKLSENLTTSSVFLADSYLYLNKANKIKLKQVLLTFQALLFVLFFLSKKFEKASRKICLPPFMLLNSSGLSNIFTVPTPL